jgi:hypothetical protein
MAKPGKRARRGPSRYAEKNPNVYAGTDSDFPFNPREARELLYKRQKAVNHSWAARKYTSETKHLRDQTVYLNERLNKLDRALDAENISEKVLTK